MKFIRTVTVAAAFAAAMLPGAANAARDALQGYRDVAFGMTRAEVSTRLDGRGVAAGGQLRAPASFELNGRRPTVAYSFDDKGELNRVTVQNAATAIFLECLATYQLYLQFVSAEHGRADYLFQDANEGIHAWRAMFLFSDGGAVHLNVTYGTEDACSVEIGYLPAPEKARLVDR
jgi:hypothetical protein